tara:strand:- start:226 stop:471 length:246 start_codon:yes stop_codon:yes gene_type:complete
MKSTLNDKDYVTFTRRFVKETVDTMGIEELKDFVVNALHEDFQEVYDDLGQRGALDDMIGWDEDTFLTVAEDFQLELEGVE